MHRPTQGPSAQRWSNGGGAWWGGSKATGAATACHTHQADRLVSGSCADGWAKKPAPLPSPTYLPANLNQPPPPPRPPQHTPCSRLPAPRLKTTHPHESRADPCAGITHAQDPPPLPPRGQGGVRDRRDRRGGGRPYAPVERPIINGALGGEVPRVVEGGGGDHGGGGEGVEVRKRTGAV